MANRKGGAGTGLSSGMLSAGAQLGTEPGADPEYARQFHRDPTGMWHPAPARGAEADGAEAGAQGDPDPGLLRKGVKLDEEYTP